MCQATCWCLSIDPDKVAFLVCAGGVDALLTVAGTGAEPVLAAAAMQALTALVGSADAKALLLQHPSFLESLLSSRHTGEYLLCLLIKLTSLALPAYIFQHS